VTKEDEMAALWQCALCEASAAGTAVKRRKNAQLCLWCEGELARTGRAWCTRKRHVVPARAKGKTWCPACESERCAQYARNRDNAAYAKTWREQNRDRAHAYGSAYREAHREELRERARTYYWSDPERAREQSRRWRAKRRHASRQYARWYYWQQPEIQRAGARRRYVRRKLAILRGVQSHG